MVEEVEKFCAELYRKVFEDRRPLEDREVEIDHSLLSKAGVDARLVPESPGVVRICSGAVVAAGGSKAGGIEPFRDPVDCASGYVLIAPRNVVGPERTRTQASAGEGVTAAPTQLDWEAALQGRDA